MPAYFFKIGGWVGLAVARNKSELWGQIDYHGDPASTEVIPAPRGSVCFTIIKTGDAEDGTLEYEYGTPERCDWFPDPDDPRWMPLERPKALFHTTKEQ